MKQIATHTDSRRAVALVTTLIMLSVVTIMAVAFLALSRRERASVNAAGDLETSKQMAAIALERVKAETASRIFVKTNLAGYEYLVSTNFQNPRRFTAGDNSLVNVNYTNTSAQLVRMNNAEQRQMLSNLQFDPRPPVFIETNAFGTYNPVGKEFRFWLDLNRNGEFEPSGLVFETDANGVPQRRQVYVTGDPEWVGVLKDPSRPHGRDNEFIGRYAYLALPLGKSLDANFIHNQAKGELLSPIDSLRYNRSEGVGSWELNLAAFLRELNVNIWDVNSYQYETNRSTSSRGIAFEDADAVWEQRTSGTYDDLIQLKDLTPLRSMDQAVPVTIVRSRLENNGVDDMSDGFDPSTFLDDELSSVISADIYSNPETTPSTYYDPQDIFDVTANLRDRILLNVPAASQSTYDKYTYYRMLGQLGVDSLPANRNQIHLNFDNTGDLGTDLLSYGLLGAQNRAVSLTPWVPDRFFNVTADRLLKQYFPNGGIGRSNIMGVTNIMVWPVNQYTPEVHRTLQLVANIYEANRHWYDRFDNFATARSEGRAYQDTINSTNQFPRVFRPLFEMKPREEDGLLSLFISGYQLVPFDDNAFDVHLGNKRFYDLSDTVPGGDYDDFMSLAAPDMLTNNVVGIPHVVAARRGMPNLNEVKLETTIEASRKLQLDRAYSTVGTRQIRQSFNVVATNQAFSLTITNFLGVEFMNPYADQLQGTSFFPFDSEIQMAYTNVWKGVVMQELPDGTEIQVWPNPAVTTGPLEILAGSDTLIPADNWIGSGDLVTYQVPLGSDDLNAYRIVLPLSTFRNGGFVEVGPQRNDVSAEPFEPLSKLPRLFLDYTNQFRSVLYTSAASPVPNMVLDHVNLRNMSGRIDILEELLGNEVNGTYGPLARVWDERDDEGGVGVSYGVDEQISISRGESQVSNFVDANPNPISGGYTEKARLKFSLFHDGVAIDPQFPELEDQVSMQAPFSAYGLIRHTIALEADDPIVHYTVEDMLDPRVGEDTQTYYTRLELETSKDAWGSIGTLNRSYQPWGGRPTQDALGSAAAMNPALTDPGATSSLAWNFPTNHYANVGTLGAVHRGTPWQTVFLKSVANSSGLLVDGRSWVQKSGHQTFWVTNLLGVPNGEAPANTQFYSFSSTHPTNDWALMDIFTTAINDNAATGLLSVNQTNTAAWAAVLAGATVLNRTPVNDILNTRVIEPATPEFEALVNGPFGINAARADTNFFASQVFPDKGSILAAPALTLESPYIDFTDPNLTDEVVERIPRRMMSLVKKDDPRLVVYAFGQALEPAPNGRYRGLGQFNGIVTNYVPTAEFVTKTIIEFEGDPVVKTNVNNGEIRSKTVSHRILFEE